MPGPVVFGWHALSASKAIMILNSDIGSPVFSKQHEVTGMPIFKDNHSYNPVGPKGLPCRHVSLESIYT